eukprot:CAMPEP_0115875136 /NCGR_PEP_ID=MMETSP0287-20121206/24929_1 /TAXON_ID=412157 /ORGANISM="Chrysochromulina rotalis, Strain UIO044" /LENGTH=46 /DNA_ID= /DNA_START= /DNA_END= /DNA_ORIENTATION=
MPMRINCLQHAEVVFQATRRLLHVHDAHAGGRRPNQPACKWREGDA